MATTGKRNGAVKNWGGGKEEINKEWAFCCSKTLSTSLLPTRTRALRLTGRWAPVSPVTHTACPDDTCTHQQAEESQKHSAPVLHCVPLLHSKRLVSRNGGVTSSLERRSRVVPRSLMLELSLRSSGRTNEPDRSRGFDRKLLCNDQEGNVRCRAAVQFSRKRVCVM